MTQIVVVDVGHGFSSRCNPPMKRGTCEAQALRAVALVEGSFTIGAITIDRQSPSVVWVGTGENNAQRVVAYGDGVYKSIDGGKSWTNTGLKESEHIGRIVIDPRNSDVVYVAAQGPLWRKGGDRGVFKTTDGGKTWNKVLGVDDWTGANDIQLDPRNPDILIATTWQRNRRTFGFIAGGPGSGIYRSTDAGKTWTKSQSGFPSEDLGRIGLSMSPANPSVVYAMAEAANDKGGFFRSRDGGASWERMGPTQMGGNYYNRIFADPKNVDRVYATDVILQVTDDGGKSFHRVGEQQKHVDNHVVVIDPDNTDHLIVGCDGGVYETFDRFQRPFSYAELRKDADDHLTRTPLPPALRDALAAIHGPTGASRLDAWRQSFEEDLRTIADQPTWAAQRAALLRCLVRENTWLSLYAATKDARFPGSWAHYTEGTVIGVFWGGAERAQGVFLRWLFAATTNACLIVTGNRRYQINAIKEKEIEVHELLDLTIKRLDISFSDFVLSTHDAGDTDGAHIALAFKEQHVDPIIAREQKALLLAEEQIVHGVLDAHVFLQTVASTDQLRDELREAVSRELSAASQTDDDAVQ